MADKNAQGLVEARLKILIATVGTSPAVLTETVWALAHEGKKSTDEIPIEDFIPDEVIAISTKHGKERAEELLLENWKNQPRPGVFKSTAPWDLMIKKLLDANKISSSNHIRFGSDNILAINTKDGRQHLNDIRTDDDATRAFEFIFEVVKRYATNPNCRIVASIAGGRKTMGAQLLSVMMMLGRWGDRVTHVLVHTKPESESEETISKKKAIPKRRGQTKEFEFDECADFFFPEQGGDAHRDAHGNGSSQKKATLAEVTLSDVKLYSLTQIRGLDAISLANSKDVCALMDRWLSIPGVEIDYCRYRRRLVVNGMPIYDYQNNKRPTQGVKIPPRGHMFAIFFVEEMADIANRSDINLQSAIEGWERTLREDFQDRNDCSDFYIGEKKREPGITAGMLVQSRNAFKSAVKEVFETRRHTALQRLLEAIETNRPEDCAITREDEKTKREKERG